MCATEQSEMSHRQNSDRRQVQEEEQERKTHEVRRDLSSFLGGNSNQRGSGSGYSPRKRRERSKRDEKPKQLLSVDEEPKAGSHHKNKKEIK